MFWKLAAWAVLTVALLVAFYLYVRWEAAQAAKGRPRQSKRRLI